MTGRCGIVKLSAIIQNKVTGIFMMTDTDLRMWATAKVTEQGEGVRE